MTNYEDLQDYTRPVEQLISIRKEFVSAHAVVFDLRAEAAPVESMQGWVSYAINSSGIVGALTSDVLTMPGERRRMHVGYAPQSGTYGGYSSGFYTQGHQQIVPDAGAKDLPVVFLINARGELPNAALAMQAAGRAAIVMEGPGGDAGAVSTQTIELADNVRAQIRLGEVIYGDGSHGFSPDLTLPRSRDWNAALLAALEVTKTARSSAPFFSPPAHIRTEERMVPARDKTYADTQFPPTEYRLLAAFRLWAAINYFYPYKELVGEDWNVTLRQFIPRMETAKDALDYNLAVVEMATHIHDSHASATSFVLTRFYGEATLPARVRIVEGLPVITAFTNAQAAKDAGLEIGDVILKVDGKDAGDRIVERLKYTAQSTPQAGMYVAGERGITRGAANSIALLTVRDPRNQVRDLRVAREVEFLPKSTGDRSGDILRVLPGNIGYADLDRLTTAMVDQMFDRFKDCRAIIFDNRGYPQETAWEIAPRLTDRNDVIGAIYKRQELRAPERYVDPAPFGSQVVETFAERLPHTTKSRYRGRTVMLIDERTISQAEHTGLFFEAANGTKFIGSPTAGANGDVSSLSVPGGITVRFSGEAVLHADGRQLQRTGLQPAVTVRPTIGGIRAGKDEVLEKAVVYLNEALR